MNEEETKKVLKGKLKKIKDNLEDAIKYHEKAYENLKNGNMKCFFEDGSWVEFNRDGDVNHS